MSHELCKAFLQSYRRVVGAQPHEKIDKRYHTNGWSLAPDDHQYQGCCGHSAEVAYLQKLYNVPDEEEEEEK